MSNTPQLTETEKQIANLALEIIGNSPEEGRAMIQSLVQFNITCCGEATEVTLNHAVQVLKEHGHEQYEHRELDWMLIEFTKHHIQMMAVIRKMIESGYI